MATTKWSVTKIFKGGSLAASVPKVYVGSKHLPNKTILVCFLKRSLGPDLHSLFIFH